MLLLLVLGGQTAVLSAGAGVRMLLFICTTGDYDAFTSKLLTGVMLIVRTPRTPELVLPPHLQVPRFDSNRRLSSQDRARSFDPHEQQRAERLSEAIAGVLQQKQNLEIAAEAAQLQERLVRSSQNVLSTLISIQACLQEVPEKRRREAVKTDEGDASKDTSQARRKGLPSLHARIIREALKVLEANECFLLVRGGGGGGCTTVKGVRDAIQAARWSRYSIDGSFVEGSPTGLARQALVEGLINTEYWGPQVLSGIVVAPDQTLVTTASSDNDSAMGSVLPAEMRDRIAAAAKKQTPSLQERILKLKKNPLKVQKSEEEDGRSDEDEMDGAMDGTSRQELGKYALLSRLSCQCVSYAAVTADEYKNGDDDDVEDKRAMQSMEAGSEEDDQKMREVLKKSGIYNMPSDPQLRQHLREVYGSGQRKDATKSSEGTGEEGGERVKEIVMVSGGNFGVGGDDAGSVVSGGDEDTGYVNANEHQVDYGELSENIALIRELQLLHGPCKNSLL